MVGRRYLGEISAVSRRDPGGRVARACGDDSWPAVALDVVEEYEQLEPAAASVVVPVPRQVIFDRGAVAELEDHVAVEPRAAAEIRRDHFGDLFVPEQRLERGERRVRYRPEACAIPEHPLAAAARPTTPPTIELVRVRAEFCPVALESGVRLQRGVRVPLISCVARAYLARVSRARILRAPAWSARRCRCSSRRRARNHSSAANLQMRKNACASHTMRYRGVGMCSKRT